MANTFNIAVAYRIAQNEHGSLATTILYCNLHQRKLNLIVFPTDAVENRIQIRNEAVQVALNYKHEYQFEASIMPV